MIANHDQTIIKFISVSNNGSKGIDVAGIENKRQITANFAASFLTCVVSL